MIRKVTLHDSQAITHIYNYYILHTAISFETEPLSVAQMQERIQHLSSHYPYWVYEEEGAILGYCYAHEWKERAAYCHTWETTIYLSPTFVGKGIGIQLMHQLIESCREAGVHALIACITNNNGASKAFHTRLGFKQVSRFEQVGQKFGEWLDVSDYELLLPR